MPTPHSICSSCGQRLGAAQAIRVAGLQFHPQCYLCAACRKPLDKTVYPKGQRLYHEACYARAFAPRCSHCQQSISGSYTRDEQGRYHPACYTQLHQLFCCLCQETLQGAYIVDHWGNKAHPQHPSGPTGQCHVCARLVAPDGSKPLADGRLLCSPCGQSEIESFAQIQEAKLAVLAQLQAVGFAYIPDYVKVTLSDDQALLNARLRASPTGNIHGFTRTAQRQIPGYGLILEHQIQIISGLPRVAFMGVLAHELLHVWIHEQGLQHLSHEQVEGFCNLGTALICQQAQAEDSALAQVLLQRMNEDPDPAYGAGYRALAWQLQNLGWPALLAALQNPAYAWPAAPAEITQAHEQILKAPAKAPAPTQSAPSAAERLQALKEKYQQASTSAKTPETTQAKSPPQASSTGSAADKVRERFAQKPVSQLKKGPGSKLGKLKRKR